MFVTTLNGLCNWKKKSNLQIPASNKGLFLSCLVTDQKLLTLTKKAKKKYVSKKICFQSTI